MTSRTLGALGALVIGVTVAAGAVYLVGQQSLRHAADHPQAELVHDAVSRLDAGAAPSSVLPGATIDIASSGATYVIIVDRLHKVVASSATLNGDQVVPPDGVFDYVKDHGEDVITWQPSPYVRSAIVVDAFDQGYVVAGRSLTDTEHQVSSLGLLTLAGWALAVAAIGGFAAIRTRR